MIFEAVQVSSLEKILPKSGTDFKALDNATVLKGESFSYQIAVCSKSDVEIAVKSEAALPIKLYAVKNAAVDFPCYPDTDEDYITKEPCLMPDILMPLDNENSIIRLNNGAAAIWVTVDIPDNVLPGKYDVKIFLTSDGKDSHKIEQSMLFDVIDSVLPEQSTIFTQWFHTDCIADIHNVSVYSEEHWSLIDKYMHLASELGINMLLTPIITPPLDTDIGLERTCCQLVKIDKCGENYTFDFSLLKRWIACAKKNNIKYFEMAHLFSQWGLKYAPNIYVTENGKEALMFGWHTDAQSTEYRNFLTAFLPSLIDFFKAEGIKERCWFHISDEPNANHLSAYKYAHDLIVPLIDGCPTLDAISDYSFYQNGLIPRPVTSICHIEPFIENSAEHLWAYYCCGEHIGVSNRFIAMPSYRNRIIGLQLYRYNIEGFLHWGYNFYNSKLSKQKINPYITTSSDNAFPSGDPFSVYPVQNGVVPSLRAIVFKEALGDIEICRRLESIIGRDDVVSIIDNAAGGRLSFSDYPRNSDFVPSLIEHMKQLIKAKKSPV